jgi:CRP-like cAMP-binding protein
MTSSSNGTKLGEGSIFCANLCQDKAWRVLSELPAYNTDVIHQALGPPSQPSDLFSGFIANSILYWNKNGPPHSAGPLAANQMKEALKKYIVEQVKSPNKAEINEILGIFEEKQFQKGEFFKTPFTTGRQIAFLPEGAVRIIIYKESGDEITARIRQENSFLTDPFRLEAADASPLGIECLEKQTLLIAPIDKFNELLETNLTLNIAVRKHLMEQLLELGKYQYLFLTGTAKERYQFVLKNNAELLKKFPLRFIASMIGITPTQLSRVRKKK